MNVQSQLQPSVNASTIGRYIRNKHNAMFLQSAAYNNVELMHNFVESLLSLSLSY